MHSPHRHPISRPWIKPLAIALAVVIGFFAAAARVGAADEKAAAKPADKKAVVAKEGDAKDGAGDAAEKITYVKHIQPIMKESCVQCHKAPAANAGRGSGGGPPGGPGARRGPGGGPGGGGPGGPGMRGPAGGLRLDDKAMILKGGKHGKAVVPGKGEESLLYKILKEPVTIEGDEIHAMPKAKPGQDFTPIEEDEIELVKRWIDQGAK